MRKKQRELLKRGNFIMIERDLWVYKINNIQEIHLYHYVVRCSEDAKSIKLSELHRQIKVDCINNPNINNPNILCENCPLIVLDHRDDNLVIDTLQKECKPRLHAYKKLVDKFNNPDYEFTWYGDGVRKNTNKHYLWSFLVGSYNGLGCYSKSAWHKERNTEKLYCQYGFDRLYFTWNDLNKVIKIKNLLIILMAEDDFNPDKARQLYSEYIIKEYNALETLFASEPSLNVIMEN